MPAVIVNTVTVLAGSLIGILFRNRLKESLRSAVMKALGLCTLLIGVSSAIATQNLLCVIVCMAVGTVLGELLRIDDGIEHAGDAIKSRLLKELDQDIGLIRLFSDHVMDQSVFQYCHLSLSSAILRASPREIPCSLAILARSSNSFFSLTVP